MTTPAATDLGKLIELVGSFGPSMAPWVLLFVFVAFFSLFLVRIAFTNTQQIVREGENLRLGYIKSLEDAHRHAERLREIIEARDARIKHLEDDQQTTINFVTTARQKHMDLEDQLHAQKRICQGLMNDLADALTIIEQQRNELRGYHDGRT